MSSGVRGGRYELLRVIASGGMATVHLGRALGAGGFERLVAVKVMHPHLAEEPEFVAMFLDEARLAARIRHPNVVATIDIQQDEQGLFLVMDYVEGPSLLRLLRALAKKERGAPPLGVALRMFVDALAGLHAAHELRGADGVPLNLIHRDVSPHNILIGMDGVARITDFGVARAEARLQTTRDGVVKGKIRYMAPEQIRAEPIDRRIDIFAAGAVLWELLAGRRLILGDSDGAMMDQIVRGNYVTPREALPSVPSEISAVCMRALATVPSYRYATAAEFAEAIEAAAAKEGVPIATLRVVSAFVKEFALEQVESSTGGYLPRALDAPPPAPRERTVTQPTVLQGGRSTTSTHSAVLSDRPEAKPPRGGGLRWMGAGVVALLAGAGWSLAPWGTWREPRAPSAASTDISFEPATTTGRHAASNPGPAAPAPISAAVAVPQSQGITASAVPLAPASAPLVAPAAPRSRPAPSTKNDGRGPAPKPAAFRPRDL